MKRTSDRTQYCLGIDLGGVHEYTALAVLESTRWHNDPDGSRRYHAVRHLQRFPPGTPYAAIRDQVAALLSREPLERATLVIDQSGVGKPVVDLFRKAGSNTRIQRLAVTTGVRASRDDAGGWLVPRQELVGVLQVLLQGGRLKVAPSLPEASLLVEELLHFKARPAGSAGGQDPVLSWREGAHDDLVLAVAVAAWQAERSQSLCIWFTPYIIDPLGIRR